MFKLSWDFFVGWVQCHVYVISTLFQPKQAKPTALYHLPNPPAFDHLKAHCWINYLYSTQNPDAKRQAVPKSKHLYLTSWRTICTQKRSHQNCSLEKPPSTLPISLKIVILSHDIRALLYVCLNTSCLFPCAAHLETMHTWLAPILLQASYTWKFSLLTW